MSHSSPQRSPTTQVSSLPASSSSSPEPPPPPREPSSRARTIRFTHQDDSLPGSSSSSSRTMPLESVHSRIWNAFPGHDLPVTPEFLFRPAPGQPSPSNVPYMRAGVASVDGRPFRGAESEVLRGPTTIQGTAHDPEQGSWTFVFKDLGFQRGTEGGKYVLEFALHLDGGKVAATLALPDIGILSLGKAK